MADVAAPGPGPRPRKTLILSCLGAGLVAACAPVEAPAAGPIPQRCNAEASRSLIGSQVGAVDFQTGANVRIVCTTCATTKDLRPDRLNIRFNQATGIIERVDCG